MDDLIAKLRAVKVRTPEEVMARSSFQSGYYFFIPRTRHYALALKALRGACAADKNSIQPEDFGLVRPLTFEETIRARVENYNRVTNPDGSERGLKDRRRLFTTFFDTASAVVYRGGTTRFKIVPLSKDLLMLGEGFSDDVLPVSYDNFSDYEELDSAARGVSYNCHISRDEILEHPAWRAAVQDSELLREYRDLVFEVCGNPEEAMGFYVDKSPAEDHLRSLFVNAQNYYSHAGSRSDLSNYISFLRVTRGDAND